MSSKPISPFLRTSNNIVKYYRIKSKSTALNHHHQLTTLALPSSPSLYHSFDPSFFTPSNSGSGNSAPLHSSVSGGQQAIGNTVVVVGDGGGGAPATTTSSGTGSSSSQSVATPGTSTSATATGSDALSSSYPPSAGSPTFTTLKLTSTTTTNGTPTNPSLPSTTNSALATATDSSSCASNGDSSPSSSTSSSNASQSSKHAGQPHPAAADVASSTLNDNNASSTNTSSAASGSSSSTNGFLHGLSNGTNGYGVTENMGIPKLFLMSPISNIKARKRHFVFDAGAYGIPKARTHNSAPPMQQQPSLTVARSYATNNSNSTTPTTNSNPSSAVTTASPHLNSSFREEPLRWSSENVENPHIEGESVQVGEDAYFIRNDSLGIADGVGGWRNSKLLGANAGRFSNLLMTSISNELSSLSLPGNRNITSFGSVDKAGCEEEGIGGGNIPADIWKRWKEVDPVEVMQKGYEECLKVADEEGLHGSSTALLALLRNDLLLIASVGDCVIQVIRDQEIIFRSEEMQHSFNYPVQLGSNSATTPEKDAMRYTIKVKKGDIVVLSSDGLNDNLFDHEILEECRNFTSSSSSSTSPSTSSISSSLPSTSPFHFTAQSLSEALCSKAKSFSQDQRRGAKITPFQVKASEEGISWHGGKNDDISVVVAKITGNFLTDSA